MPENWKTYKLGDVTNWKSGATPSKSKPEFWNGDIPWISAKTLIGRYVSNSPLKISKAALTKGGRIAEKGSILFLVRGSGLFNDIPVAMVSRDVAFNQDIKCVVPISEELEDLFLLYWFKGKKQTFTDILEVTGIGAGKFDMSRVFNLELSIPPLPEQHVIASILSTLDDKIENNLAMNKTLEAMATALYKHWFVDFGPFQDGKFIDSELGLIPEGWEVKSMDEEFDISIGRTPPRKEPHWFSTESGVKWVSIKDMGNSGSYIFHTSEYLTNEAVDKKNVPVVPENTALLSFKLTVGRVCISTEKMVTNEAIAHFAISKDTRLSTEFVYLALKCFDYNSLASTSSIATAVNSKTVKSMQVLVPTIDVQKAFDKDISRFFGLIKSNALENQNLTNLRDTLLPNLISGEVRAKARPEDTRGDIEKKVSKIL